MFQYTSILREFSRRDAKWFHTSMKILWSGLLRNWPFTTHTSMIENNTQVCSYLPTHIKRLWMLWMHQSLCTKSLSVCLPLDKWFQDESMTKTTEGSCGFCQSFLNFTKIEVHRNWHNMGLLVSGGSGVSQRGAPTHKGRQPIFPENCLKMKKYFPTPPPR